MEMVTSSEGVTNTSLSYDQVSEELDTLRVRSIGEMEAQTLFRRPYQGFTQRIKSIKVSRMEDKSAYLDIPRIVLHRHHAPAILYIGGTDGKNPYRVVTGNGDNELHDQFIGKLPIAIYNEGRFTFKNASPSNLMVVAVFEDPSDLEAYGEYDNETSEYPMPAGLIDIAIGKLTESYIRTMFRIRPQPNTQADIPNAGPQSK
jgi:hypothetical protein